MDQVEAFAHAPKRKTEKKIIADCADYDGFAPFYDRQRENFVHLLNVRRKE